jgi:hypothetical protein
MTDRELMQQALAALEWNLTVIEDYGDKEQLQAQYKAITALSDRLAQPERQWVGLTDEDMAELRRSGLHSISDKHFFAIEAKLREKNT